MRRRRLALSVVVIAAVLLAGRAVSVLYADFTWYDSLGASSVWLERISDSALLYSAGIGIGFLFVFLNLVAARESIGRLTRPRRLANVEFGEAIPANQIKAGILVISAAVALALTAFLPSWQTVARARLGIVFSEYDPYTQHDLSFYVGWLPLERDMYRWSLALVLAVLLLVFSIYVITRGLRWAGGSLLLQAPARRHLGALVALLLLLCAWSYRLDSYELLTGVGRESSSFGYVDHEWLLPGLVGLALLSAATAITIGVSAWTGQLRTGLIAIMVTVASAALVQQMVPFALERIVSPGDARARNAPYAATRADFTSRAFPADPLAELATPSIEAPAGTSGQPIPDTVVAPGATGMILLDAPTLDVAGPSLGTGIRRLAQAWAARDFALLSDSLKRRSRIVRVRDVRDRVSRLFPLLEVGPMPLPTFRADTLYWTAPLYSSSDSYPLSERRETFGGLRTYFHRIGTVLINARTGRVWAAMDTPFEPVAAAWVRNFLRPEQLAQSRTIQRSLELRSLNTEPAAMPTDTSFTSESARLYEKMRSALAAGDSRAFAAAFDSLGSLVERGRK